MSDSDSDEPGSGFTRRDLMRGALVGAVAAGIGGKVGSAAAPVQLGPAPIPIELKVNGQLHHLTIEPRVLLVDALRERLGLTGTKIGCGRGACGACTVMVDGETACSCLLLAAEVQGKSIQTIEGLAAGGRLTPLQQAFVAADALQCGFCTSGMLMSCHALLQSRPRPSREEIREAVAGNLCRCGAYPHIFEAVEQAAGLNTGLGTRNSGRDSESRVPRPASRLWSDQRVDAALIDLEDSEEA